MRCKTEKRELNRRSISKKSRMQPHFLLLFDSRKKSKNVEKRGRNDFLLLFAAFFSEKLIALLLLIAVVGVLMTYASFNVSQLFLEFFIAKKHMAISRI